MKKILCAVLIAALIVPSMVRVSASSFTDIQNHWAKADIEECADLGFVNGRDNTYFDPDAAISRAEFVAVANRAFPSALNNPTNNVTFSDVGQSDWFCQDVQKAADAGLIQGRGNNWFDPSAPITREEAAVVLYNYMLKMGYNFDITNIAFADEYKIDTWATLAVHYLASVGIINGYEDNEFRPLNNITRAEAATIVIRAYDQSVNISTASPTARPSASPSVSPSAVPTSSGAPTVSPTATVVPTGAAVPSATATATPTVSATATPSATPTYVPPSVVPFDFSLEDFYYRLDGSTVTLPLAQNIVANKFSQYVYGGATRAEYNIIFNKTDEATKNVINGTKDVALVTYPDDENLALAQSEGVQLSINPVVNDAFVFLISNDVPIDSLTTRQIKDIYEGNITNWDEIPGCSYDKAIEVFGRIQYQVQHLMK